MIRQNVRVPQARSAPAKFQTPRFTCHATPPATPLRDRPVCLRHKISTFQNTYAGRLVMSLAYSRIQPVTTVLSWPLTLYLASGIYARASHGLWRPYSTLVVSMLGLASSVDSVITVHQVIVIRSANLCNNCCNCGVHNLCMNCGSTQSKISMWCIACARPSDRVVNSRRVLPPKTCPK